MATIYALLIGINSYPVKPLNGCINDVNAVEACLTSLYGNRQGITLNFHRITDADEVRPTRKNIIEGFRFFEPAAADDCCLLYYSGHGSYTPAPTGFWTENDQRSESFVCIDSRIDNGKDLMDKEMGFLIWKTMQAKADTSFVVITDCCHSGTITRTVDNSGITDRMMPDAGGPVQFNEYLGFGETVGGKSYYHLSTEPDSTGSRINCLQGKHIHLAASRDNQTAKELNIDGQKRGAFTHSLLKTLYETGGNISYRQLVNRAALLVRNLVSDQSPGIHLNGIDDKMGDKVFLTHINTAGSGYLLYHDPLYKWCIKGGPVHGLSSGDIVLIDGVGESVITGSPAADVSTINPIMGLVQGTTIYQVQVIKQAAKQISIAFSDEVPLSVQANLKERLSIDRYVSFSLTNDTTSKLVLHYKDALVSITQAGSLTPLISPLPVGNDAETGFLLERLQIICSWLRVQELHQASFTSKPYQLSLYRNTCGSYAAKDFEMIEDPGSSNEFNYSITPDGTPVQPAFRLVIRNTGPQPLWISSAWLGFDYSIETGYFEDIQLLAPGAEAWLTVIQNETRDDIILLNLDEKYSSLGYNEITEYLKLFISFEAIDINGLKQVGIDLPLVQTKSAGDRSPGSVRGANGQVQRQWATETIPFKIRSPAP